MEGRPICAYISDWGVHFYNKGEKKKTFNINDMNLIISNSIYYPVEFGIRDEKGYM